MRREDAFPIVLGVIAAALLAGTLTIAALKAGITPGVSPLVILFAWGAFSRRVRVGGSRFLNQAQLAGSSGAAVCAGVVFTAPLLQILYTDKGLPLPPVDVGTLIVLSLGGALIGFGFVGLGTRKFLTDPTLPAPEARACEKLVEVAVTEPDKRPALGRSLYAGLAASFVAPLLARMGVAHEGYVLHQHTHGEKPDERTFSLALPFNPIYLGIGGLLTLATALLVFGGSMLRVLGDLLVTGVDPGSLAAQRFPGNSMRWVGGGAMTVAVAYSLVRFLRVRLPLGQGRDALVEVDPDKRRMLGLSIVAGALIVVGWLFIQDGPTPFSFAMTVAVVACCSVMVVLGAILSLQIGSSASPVSGTIFVTTLVLCLTALAVGRNELDDVVLLTPLLVAACVAVCSANDSSQDYKTMQLCGVRVQDGFVSQLLGLVAGCVIVPLALDLMNQSNPGGLGDEEVWSAPQANMFATLIDGLLLSQSVPWYPIVVGLGLGLFALAADIAGQKKGIPLPCMALAVGIYLPPALGIGLLIGALFRYVAERGRGQSSASILTAGGFITGAALFELLLGVLLAGAGYGWFDFDEGMLLLWKPPEDPVKAAEQSTVQSAVALIGIGVLGFLLWLNSRRGRGTAPSP